MNETNRMAIVLFAAFWIVVMVVVIFLTWAAPDDVIDTLGDLVSEMDENNDTAGRLIVTLGALALAVLALLVIILELAPEDEERELRVRQAGATTIVPAQALRTRLQESLRSLPDVNGAKARVWTKDNSIATSLELSLRTQANLANVTQEASRVVVDIIQTELGLPVAGMPDVRVSFGGEKPLPVTKAVVGPAAAGSVASAATAASSVSRPPETEPREMLGGAEDAPPSEPAVIDATEGTADSSPGPLVYESDEETGSRDEPSRAPQS